MVPTVETQRRSDRGSVLPIVAVVVVVVLVSMIGVDRLGDVSVRRARADAVADVAVLSAVQGGPDGAARVATANAASVADYTGASDGSVQIELRRDGVSATAAAAPLGAELPGGPDLVAGRR